MKLAILREKFSLDNLTDTKSIVLKQWHFVVLSVIFHINIILPLFLELYFNKWEAQEQVKESVVYLSFSDETFKKKQPATKHNKAKKAPKSETKNKNLKTQDKEKHEPTQQEIDNMNRDYEEKMSSRVAFVLEQNIDKYDNIYGNFTLEYNVDKTGKVIGYKIHQEEDDELAIEELKELLKSLNKFDAIPKAYPDKNTYRFSVPISIEAN